MPRGPRGRHAPRTHGQKAVHGCPYSGAQGAFTHRLDDSIRAHEDQGRRYRGVHAPPARDCRSRDSGVVRGPQSAPRTRRGQERLTLRCPLCALRQPVSRSRPARRRTIGPPRRGDGWRIQRRGDGSIRSEPLGQRAARVGRESKVDRDESPLTHPGGSRLRSEDRS